MLGSPVIAHPRLERKVRTRLTITRTARILRRIKRQLAQIRTQEKSARTKTITVVIE